MDVHGLSPSFLHFWKLKSQGTPFANGVVLMGKKFARRLKLGAIRCQHVGFCSRIPGRNHEVEGQDSRKT